MDFEQFIKANERMEKFLGKKIAILHDMLLHKKPDAVLKDLNGNISLVVFPNKATLSIIQYGEDYIAVLRIPDELSEELKIPSIITTLIPNTVVDSKNLHDVLQTFIASVQADLAEFFA